MPPRACWWRGTVDRLGVEIRWRRGFPRLIRERIAGPSYRSIRGSPKCGKTLLAANQVIADIRSLPSSVVLAVAVTVGAIVAQAAVLKVGFRPVAATGMALMGAGSLLLTQVSP